MDMIALIDYNMGNLFSVTRAFEHCGAKLEVVSSATELAKFDAAILPGVGNFGEGMEHLQSYGLANPIREFVAQGKPLLGICLGMQMLLDSSEEAPNVVGLGLIPGAVRRFADCGEKVPQMGWNQVKFAEPLSPVFAGIEDESFFYFVHSFYADPTFEKDIIGFTDYTRKYASAIGRNNLFGMQFHPEKSQDCGLKLIKNFTEIAQCVNR